MERKKVVSLVRASVILVLIYLVGIYVLRDSYLELDYEPYTWAILLITGGVTLFYHSRWNVQFIVRMLLIIVLGFFVEVYAVNTGNIFGHYTYDTSLGYKLWGTPLIIGFNWAILSYYVANITVHYRRDFFTRIALSAGLLLALDLFLERFAGRHHLWTWPDPYAIPIQNYVAWFLISAVFAVILSPVVRRTNMIALLAYMLTVLLVTMA